MTKVKIGWVGLGTMGIPMVRNLLSKDFQFAYITKQGKTATSIYCEFILDLGGEWRQHNGNGR